MRLGLIVVASAVVSFVVSFATVYAASHWMSCTDDHASCGMGEVYGVFGTIVYAFCAMIVFWIVAWRAPTERAVAIATIALLLPIALILLFGMAQVGRVGLRDLQGLLQFHVPLAVVVVLQWLVLRAWLRRRAG